VEDEDLLLRAITKEMQMRGVDILSCASAQQALDYLQTIGKLPDAIWLDYYLKDMNGIAFLQKLKANPTWQGVPVIVVSNSASHDKVSSMLTLGANKYILKANYTLDQIIAMVSELIGEAK
jgi:two-component system chemotaxis response regulator CheY